MRNLFLFLSLVLISSISSASNLKLAQSILANTEIMTKAAAMALKEAEADEFMAITVVTEKNKFQASITFKPKEPGFFSRLSFNIYIHGKTDGEKVLSVTEMYSESE